MEVGFRDLIRAPLGSASFLDLRLPEGKTFRGQNALQDTLAIHVRPRELRQPPGGSPIESRSCRRRLPGRPHVGMLHVRRAGVLYVAYFNPSDETLLERVKRLRARGYFWLCMYDLVGNFGLCEYGPLEPDFMESILEVREEAKRVTPELFERAADEVDWTLKNRELVGLRQSEGLEDFRCTVCTARTARVPRELLSS